MYSTCVVHCSTMFEKQSAELSTVQLQQQCSAFNEKCFPNWKVCTVSVEWAMCSVSVSVLQQCAVSGSFPQSPSHRWRADRSRAQYSCHPIQSPSPPCPSPPQPIFLHPSFLLTRVSWRRCLPCWVSKEGSPVC